MNDQIRSDQSVPSWWNPKGMRSGGDGFGQLEAGYLRQSEDEALRWATARCVTPATAGIAAELSRPITIYSDGVSHQLINDNFYAGHETDENAALRYVLGLVEIPEGVIVWRGAGFKLFDFPELPSDRQIETPAKAQGLVFDHRPPISTAVGNALVPKGAGQPVWYKLQVDPGVRGLFIPEVAVHGNDERELLLAPGTRVRIETAEQIRDQWYVLATALA